MAEYASIQVFSGSSCRSIPIRTGIADSHCPLWEIHHPFQEHGELPGQCVRGVKNLGVKNLQILFKSENCNENLNDARW